jgi:hypothetical protein
VGVTLIDFGTGGSSSAARGDAVLSLLLFEPDSYDTVSKGDGLLLEKIYKGGSHGGGVTALLRLWLNCARDPWLPYLTRGYSAALGKH